jgi:serine/threonine-protein kinase HipA
MMNRLAKVYFHDSLVGTLSETDMGYDFEYDKRYLTNTSAAAISKTLPLQNSIFKSKTLFPFFDGLIPEGWLLDIAEKNWKLQSRDRFGLLLKCCMDCIGAVSVRPE